MEFLSALRWFRRDCFLFQPLTNRSWCRGLRRFHVKAMRWKSAIVRASSMSEKGHIFKYYLQTYFIYQYITIVCSSLLIAFSSFNPSAWTSLDFPLRYMIYTFPFECMENYSAWLPRDEKGGREKNVQRQNAWVGTAVRCQLGGWSVRKNPRVD